MDADEEVVAVQAEYIKLAETYGMELSPSARTYGRSGYF